MKALRIHEHGSPDVLRWEEAPPPELKPDGVRIAVKVNAINHLDLWVRRGIPGMKIELPRVLGADAAGTVIEVGPEVLEGMAGSLPRAAEAFRPRGAKYLADLFALGRQALRDVGVTRIHGGTECTYSDPERFYSFRRDRVTGRHAALVWIDPA